jgi:hypothetical protein
LNGSFPAPDAVRIRSEKPDTHTSDWRQMPAGMVSNRVLVAAEADFVR